MRCYKLMLAAFMALGLWACSGEPVPEAATPPASEAVTPASDMSASAAAATAQAGADGQEAAAALGPFPGQANMLPSIKALTEFCKRPGSLAFMTRDGCHGALSELSRDIAGNLHFESMEDCQDFLQKRRADRNNIVAAHREWCERSYDNIHDRKGCYDAGPVFLGSFTEQGFCRRLPPAKPKPEQPVDAEAPYLYGYSEPGQKFDSPKTGWVPRVKKPAPAKKVPTQKASGLEAAPVDSAPVDSAPAAKNVAAQPAAPRDYQAQGQAPAVVQAAPPAARPVPPGAGVPLQPGGQSQPAAGAPAISGAGVAAPAASLSAAPVDGLDPQAPEGVPSWPAGMDFSNTPEAQPAPAPVIPVLPVPGAALTQNLPEPPIGPREEVKALPPVPSIGRIAPQLMPGVPPDTAVSDNTLPDETEAPQVTEVPQGSPLGSDAFGDIIPNFMPPPPPNPLEGQTQPMPLSGAPAGQAGF